MVREYEYVSADYTEILPGGEALPPRSLAPGRLIYAEAVPLDVADARLTGGTEEARDARSWLAALSPRTDWARGSR